MMNILRKNMKVILWIVVIAFVSTIFFVWGMDAGRREKFVNQQSAAVVNNQPISYADFERLYEQQSQELFGRGEQEPTRAQIQQLRNELARNLIDRQLLKQQFEKLGFDIPGEEVAARIAATPAFQQDGKFSQEKYLTLLQYNRVNPQDFEAEQQTSLELLKMDRILRNATVVTDDQARAYFLSRSRQLKLSLVSFNWKDHAKAIAIPEGELKDYFEKHRQEFDQPVEVRVSHILVRFDSKATEEQKLTAKLKLENIRQDVLKGADFAATAKKQSEDPGSAAKGGDLGFFKSGMMVPTFEKAAFALKVGELSAPVETPFGFHLLKCTDRREEKRPTFSEVRAKILDQLQETEAKKKMLAASKEFMAQLKTTQSIAKAATATKTRLITTGWLTVDGSIPGVGNSEMVLDKAFDLAVHHPSGAVRAGEGAAFVEVSDEKYQPFSENHFQQKRTALLEKLKEINAEQVMLAWLEEAKQQAKIVNNIAGEGKQQVAEEQAAEAATTPGKK